MLQFFLVFVFLIRHTTTDHLNPSSVALFPEDAEPLTRRKYLAAMESSEKAWIEALIHEYLLRYSLQFFLTIANNN